MAMSDCEKCWETPCACGHEYKNKQFWPMAKLVNLRDILNKEIAKREKSSNKSVTDND